MKRLTAMLAATAFATGLLSGCGGDADAYCDSLESIQKDFEDFEGGADFSNFDDFADRVDEVADDAPDEVKDDWEVLAEAFDAFVDALEDAGIEPGDLENLATNPDGVDPEALGEVMTAAQGLNSDEVQTATDNIDKHAQDECNIEFTAS